MMQNMGQQQNILGRCGSALVRAAGIIAISAASLFLAPPAAASGAWSANDDDALLFDLRSGNYRLGDGVRGYQTDSGICVDLADMIIAMDIPLRLDKKSRRATGWSAWPPSCGATLPPRSPSARCCTAATRRASAC